jgi:hypothetical protein
MGQPMIHTTSKDKLPKFLSYPIGAEILTDALSSSPQIEKLTVSLFTRYGSLQDKKYRTQPYPILRINYRYLRSNRYTSNSFVESGYYDSESWHITVVAIPAELKSQVRKLLLSEGLPQILSWLQAERTALWLEGHRQFVILFDEKDSTLSYSDAND